MELLWPGLLQPSAQVNLRQTLYRLSQAIPEVAARTGGEPVPFLLADRQTVQINPDSAYELDVATFTELLRGEPRLEELTQAVALYRGDFLADFYLPDSNVFEEWAAAWRANLRRQVLEALSTLATTYTQQGDYAAAITTARRQLEIYSARA